MVDDKPVIMELKLSVGHNPIGLVPGTIIDVRIQIVDEFEVIHTSNARFTQDLVKVAPKGTIARYSQRNQRTVIKYPGKNKQEIAKIVAEDLKHLPGKVKEK